MFHRFRAEHPHHPVVVRNDTSQRMPELVRERRIDVGVASSVAPAEGVRAIPWQELELALVRPAAATIPEAAPPGPSPAAPPVALASLTPAPVILPSAGMLRTLTEGFFARHDLAPAVAAECDSLEVVKALVAGGFGQAVLPRVCLAPGEPGLEVVAIREPLPRLPVAALVAQRRVLPAAVAAFLRVLGIG
jgi:DNA-binding transcriptional LysR family regulator